MKLKKLTSALCAAAFGLATASASAGVTWFFPKTSFEDDNLDYVFDTGPNGRADGVLGVGDRLVSVLEFNTTKGILPGQTSTPIGPGAELTGIADITIVAISPTGEYIFAPTGATGLLGSFAAGTAIAIWLDTTPDVDVTAANCAGDRANCISLAGLGADAASSVWMTAGFFGDPDAFWFAQALSGGGTIGTVQNGPADQKFGLVNFALDIGINNTGRFFDNQACGAACNPVAALGQDDKTKLVGSADILGGEGLSAAEWTARSDTDAGLRPLPEPASIALLGLGLAGLGMVRRRKQ